MTDSPFLIVKVDGADVNGLKDLLGTIFKQIIRCVLNKEMTVNEDVEEFKLLLDEAEAVTVSVFIENSHLISAACFGKMLRIFNEHLSNVNISFFLDAPKAELPISVQNRLLNVNLVMPRPIVLIDELVHRLLLNGAMPLLSKSILDFILGQVFERSATFWQIVKMFQYVMIYAWKEDKKQVVQTSTLIALYTLHFAFIRVLKQEKSLVETICMFVDEENCSLRKSTMEALMSSRDRLVVLGDVQKVFVESKHPVVLLESGDQCLRDICGLIERPGQDINTVSLPIDHLKRAFLPDMHLAIQSGLKCPGLYLNSIDGTVVNPVCLLYRYITERAAFQIPIASLYDQFTQNTQSPEREKAQDRQNGKYFYPALKSLQIVGMIAPGRNGNHIQRLNVNDDPCEDMF